MKSEVPIRKLPLRGLQEAEFVRVYKLPVVVVPTNVPSVRVDLPMEVYPNARGKWTAVAVEVRAMRELGRPVLVGTTSVTSSEVLSDILTAYNISHNLLNARPQVSDAKRDFPPLTVRGGFTLMLCCLYADRGYGP
jgi:preprotein translocase subunit SecA